MVGAITQGKTYSRIKLKIYGTMFLYSKERWILMVSSRLQKVKVVHKKRQNVIAINQRSNQQTQECEIL